MSDPVAKRLGDYEILGVLGSGGMGRVYKVRNVITDRVEAMKVLLPDLQGHEDVAARFLREIKVLAALKHPNIAALLTALTIDNQLVMIMEYVEGQSLSSRLNDGPIAVSDALNYVDQVLEALSYAHHQHVIHRDIKPANMMLTPDRKVKLMDFGIARSGTESKKLTATGSTLGSLSYMSPEQVKGEATDERSDLYSVGISLYEMVTGQKPFHGDSDFSVMVAQINQPPTPPAQLQPGLPRLVNQIILQSIAKAPEQRFQSADAFRNAVKEARREMQNEVTMVQGSEEVPAIGAGVAQSSADAATTVRGSQEATVPAAAARTVAAAAAVTAMKQTPEAPPAPAAQPMPLPPPQHTSHRGLYMALGALVVVLVLVAAGLYIPSRKKASAASAPDSGNNPSAMTATTSSATSASSQAPQQATSANPSSDAAQANTNPNIGDALGNTISNAVNKEVNDAVNKGINNALTNGGAGAAQHKKLVGQDSGSGASGGAANGRAAVDTAQLDAIEHEIDQLTSRVAAVNSSLDNLQRQQQAEGYGLRGDMASKQASMKVNLAKAQDAIEHNDAARAKRYVDMTTADVEALEKFLGR